MNDPHEPRRPLTISLVDKHRRSVRSIRYGDTDLINTTPPDAPLPRPANDVLPPMTNAEGWATLCRMERQVRAKLRESDLTWEQLQILHAVLKRLQRVKYQTLQDMNT